MLKKLFLENNKLYSKHLLLRYCIVKSIKGGMHQVVFPIAKKQVPAATLRNALRRQLREAYRHTQNILPAPAKTAYLFYLGLSPLGKELPTQDQLQREMQRLWARLLKKAI